MKAGNRIKSRVKANQLGNTSCLRNTDYNEKQGQKLSVRTKVKVLSHSEKVLNIFVFNKTDIQEKVYFTK